MVIDMKRGKSVALDVDVGSDKGPLSKRANPLSWVY